MLFEQHASPRLIGVVHLLPLPGAYDSDGDLSVALERARHDARALYDGGADAIIVENFGDAPFFSDHVDHITVACMVQAANAVRDAAPGVPLGINVLRNDAIAALAVAKAAGAQFIRVNVHAGAMVTDQGLIQASARATLAERKRLHLQAPIAADVLVKHAAPLGNPKLADVARDTWYRGRAGALIISGAGTGLPARLSDLDDVRQAVPQAPIWLGSGFTPDRAAELSTRLDAAIVGTWLHEDADLSKPLDAERVREAKAALVD